MELIRDKSKISNKRRVSTELFTDEQPPISTPVHSNIRSDDQDSPYFMCSTQDMREDVDVLWDYNSPQSRQKTNKTSKKPKKRLNLQQSPKVPFRRHPSTNNEQIKQDFCKLREELQALRAEIARPDHEESLVLSPREEDAFRITQYEPNIEENHETFESDYEDPFNDDMDDKLIMYSQQLETEILQGQVSKRQLTNYNCDNNAKEPVTVLQDSIVFNDSLDNALSQMGEDDFDQLTQVVDIKQYKNDMAAVITSDKKSKAFPRSYSEEQIVRNIGRLTSGKVEWHRTQSFESYADAELTKEKLKEIEQKRLEAKAKREAKKKHDNVSSATIPTLLEDTDSPLKCSPEEIEKKRLQALAKLEAKRQQEFIEKKKQEALRRREENRKRNARLVKSSLNHRL